MINSDLVTQLKALQSTFDLISEKLDIEAKKNRVEQLETERQDPEFWQDQFKVKSVGQEIARLNLVLNEYDYVIRKIDDLKGIVELGKDYDDQGLNVEFVSTLREVEALTKKLDVTTFLSGPYDDHDAVLSIHAGQGGTEACDWAGMLSRMYQRYVERKDWSFEIVDESRAEEGLKSITFLIHGSFAYGLLKHDKGAHRLVRLSPFNADHLRQTSFAGVDVMPLIPEDDKDVEVKPDDLEWQFTRAGGHGGQNVNKVNSAVILKHLPTGVIVECRQERYQEQNKKTALSILKSKLAILEEEKRQEEISKIKGEHKIAGWGNQIRNYVLHPYHLVKDTRTKVETSDTDAVLDGDLDVFTQSNVRML